MCAALRPLLPKTRPPPITRTLPLPLLHVIVTLLRPFLTTRHSAHAHPRTPEVHHTDTKHGTHSDGAHTAHCPQHEPNTHLKHTQSRYFPITADMQADKQKRANAIKTHFSSILCHRARRKTQPARPSMLCHRLGTEHDAKGHRTCSS